VGDKRIANIFEEPLRDWKKGEKFEAKLARIGTLVGAEQLGCQYQIIPAGKAAYPFHAHHKNEELFLVLEGEGTYRLGEERLAIKKGDVISAPAGNAKTAHQIINTSGADLALIAISTRHDPEVVDQPDSGKFLVVSRVPADTGFLGADLVYVGKRNNTLDYWDGEDTGSENADAQNVGEQDK
jgi:uncharacterized cupin superfamily protein